MDHIDIPFTPIKSADKDDGKIKTLEKPKL